MGPNPINEGSTPQVAQDTILTNDSNDFFSACSLDIKTKAAAPSFIPEEFPGVTVPFSLNTVFNFFRSSILKFSLGCSSFSKINFLSPSSICNLISSS